VLPASPDSGVNTLTGQGLAEALAGAQVVVDVSNSSSFEDEPVMKFFRTSTSNILAAEEAAGVKHHLALSVVGTDRLQESGYFRAKLVQENLIKASPIPYTILRSTQFFEFVVRIAQAGADGKTVSAASAFIQPIVSDDVVKGLADLAVAAPGNGTVEIAGPERFHLDDLVRRALKAAGDAREVVTDARTRYFGALLDEETLTPDSPAMLGTVHFSDWVSNAASRSAAPKQAAA
jgi:uncharacterized protein YbjT (DUF2867 family)